MREIKTTERPVARRDVSGIRRLSTTHLALEMRASPVAHASKLFFVPVDRDISCRPMSLSSVRGPQPAVSFAPATGSVPASLVGREISPKISPTGVFILWGYLWTRKRLRWPQHPYQNQSLKTFSCCFACMGTIQQEKSGRADLFFLHL